MRARDLGLALLFLSATGTLAADGPRSEHPLAPSSVMLRGGSSHRVVFQARWKGETGAVDPTAQGGTLRIIGGPNEGDSGLVELPAERWTVRKRVLRYQDRAGTAAGIRSVILRVGKKGGIVKIIGRGAWPYTIDRPQTEVTVTFGIGVARWCAKFDADNLDNGNGMVRGHSKIAPASCPCEAPATSTFAGIQTAIFERHGCTQAICHGASPGEGSLDLRPDHAYASLVDVPSTILPSQKRVEPGARDQSLLYRKLAASTLGLEGVPGAAMPNGAFAPLSPSELRAIELWIYNGAAQEGVVKGTDTLLGSCLPPPEPQKIRPPEHPGPGEGVQLYSPPWTIPANGEGEVCFATWYDFSAEVPDELKFPCPNIWGGPSRECFAYKRTELTQDPNSHHSILRLYRGNYPITDPGFGTFTCHGGANAGTACDPLKIGVPAPTGADCGERSGCAGSVVPAVACIGYGPPDLSVGAKFGADSETTPQITISTSPYYKNAYPPDVYNVMPVSGIFVENSHAFNATDEPTTNEQWLNIYFATPAERKYIVQDLFDGLDIFIENVPPFEKREYCRTFTMPVGTRMFEMYSHTHKRGKLFRGWGPGIPTTCSSSYTTCTPETTEPFLVTTDYADPDIVHWPDGLVLDGDAAARTFKYCALYDNGATDPSKVKRLSTSPLPPFGIGSCKVSDTACVDGPHKGEPCNGSNAACDSSPGLGDGVCDACPLRGGVTTDDEMFIMLGAYYCAPGSPCEATIEP
jgi:hypothetical protein